MKWLWFGLAGFGLTLVGGYLAAALVNQASIDRIFQPERPARGVLAWLSWTLRNVLGLALVAGGLVLLVVPGPGILAIVAGLLISELPGRRTLLRMLLSRAAVRRGVDRLRTRRGKAPIVWPQGVRAASG